MNLGMTLSRTGKRQLALSLGLLVTAAPAALARDAHPRGGQVQIPSSSTEQPSQIGLRAHTNIRVFVPTGGMDGIAPPTREEIRRQLAPQQSAPPYSGYYYVETPASLACVYNLVVPTAGCNPYYALTNPAGGARAIALVDAYDNPTAAADLAAFSTQFGLPAANFQVVYASGTQPATDSGWALESSLDIEWAHAMAPNAKIYLVEAANSNLASLGVAVRVASNLVAQAGGGEVSMSWGSSEFPGETNLETYLTTPKVVYVASSGDAAGVSWPSSSPNVVSAGGTTMSRNPTTGDFQKEVSWESGGGGPSAYEPRPAYQSGVSGIVGSARGTPDIAAVADPDTGVWVRSNQAWYVVGGTSVAAPVIAGIINAAGRFSASTADELSVIYSGAGFTPITSGVCGPYDGYLAEGSWSFCTGNGSPNGLGGK